VPASPVTIVTGSSRGIGLAIARSLARAGHRLVLVARDGMRLETTARDLVLAGGQAVAVPLDLRSADAATRVVAAAVQAFGPPDVVVNNAGTAPSDKIENTTDATLTETFDLHVRAPFALARACVPHWKQARSGCLVQLASGAGLRGYPFTAAYTTAKHGMVGLSRALHAELAPAGIHVYAVCPGFVDTDITRQAAAAVAARGRSTEEQAFQRMAAQNRIGRMHTVQEVADAVVFLVRERPQGCVYDLDRQTPAFVD
jgi:NAD(P)-dependent dehydrogenase (short-subunit alcohol dehydrogenase family)